MPGIFCVCQWILVSWWVCLCLHTRCRRRGLLLRLITFSDRRTHTHSGGFLWTRDRPVAESENLHCEYRLRRISKFSVLLLKNEFALFFHVPLHWALVSLRIGHPLAIPLPFPISFMDHISQLCLTYEYLAFSLFPLDVCPQHYI